MGFHAYREGSNAVQHSSRREFQSQKQSLCGNWTDSVVSIREFRSAQGKLSNKQDSRGGGSIKRRLIGGCDRFSYPTRTCRIWANGTLYLFDSQGRILWNFSTPDDEPIFSATLSHNGSVILASSPGLFYLNHQGKILWSGSGLGYGSIGAAQLVNDGLEVVAGLSNYGTGSSIVMYDDQGKILWKYSINDSSIFDSTRSLAVSNSHIAAGTTVSGYNGTLHYMDFSGNQVWSRHINSAILGVDFIENGLEISVQTNWGTQTFDLTGNRIN